MTTLNSLCLVVAWNFNGNRIRV